MNINYFDNMLIKSRATVGGNANLCACVPVSDL